jgi:hypothetical protein
VRLDDVLRLVAVYSAWDQRPGDRARAVECEQACAVVAAQLRITTTELRIRISSARHDGADVRSAIGKAIS